ncbi:MAG: mechanosensitive ion channel family protein [Luteibaculum sp.]
MLAVIANGFFASATAQDSTVLEKSYFILSQDTLFALSIHDQDRIAAWMDQTDSLLSLSGFNPDEINLVPDSTGLTLAFKSKPIGKFFRSDRVFNENTLTQIAIDYKAKLRELYQEPGNELNKLYQTLKQFAIFLLIAVLSYGIYWLVNRVYLWFAKRIKDGKLIRMRTLSYRNIEVLNKDRMQQLVLLSAKVLRTLLAIIFIYLLIPTVFSFFPTTRDISRTLFAYIFKPINRFGKGLFEFLPELILIGLILVLARVAIRFFRFWSKEVGEGRLVLKGFYKDWAKPTFNLVRFVIYLVTVIVIVHNLPGANTPLFLGFLAFLGLAIALASAKSLSNFISGIFLTYMRSFKVGDRVRVNEASGVVSDKNLFITRIKTKSNEFITIPNSQMMDAYVVNYSASENDLGLVVYCEFWLGSEHSFNLLSEKLTQAALRADSIVDNPKPVLLITETKPGLIKYKLNAYTLNSGKLERIKSSLFRQVKASLEKEGINL